jgi:hypothetical protein
MTADPYVRDRAGRFAKLPPVLFRDCPPIPEPQPVPDEGHLVRIPVSAPVCAHGHFTRWALGCNPKTGAPNCPPCHQEARRAR